MLRPRLLLLGLLVSAVAASAQTPTRTTAIPDQTLSTGATAGTIDLKTHFGTTGFPTTPVALFDTVAGSFYVELLTTAAPKHVENFTAYANEGSFDMSFFHRTSSLESDTTTGLPIIDPANAKSAPKVIQGGAYRVLPTGFGNSVRTFVPQKDPIALEFNQPNVRGTLAAARGSAANSATSQWFFNVTDNTTVLGQVNGQGGYSVFGRVIGTGMEVVDALAAFQRFRYADAFPEFPLRNYTSGPVLDQNLALVRKIRVVSTYPADASTPGILRFDATAASADIVTPKVVGSTLQLVPKRPGTTQVTVNAYDARNTAVSWTFNVTVAAPYITRSPDGKTVAPGGTATLAVTAEGSGALAYQWRKNGTAITGATGATLTLANLAAADAGEYSVAVSQGSATTISRPAAIRVETPVPSALANLSVRGNISPSILGFGSTGGARQLLVRAVGPSLSQFNLTGFMPNPKVEIIQPGANGQNTIIALNDSWGTSAATLQPIFSQVGAFALNNTSSQDAAVVASVSGQASAVVMPANGSDGLALTEIYDLAPGNGGRLINLSSRTWVGTGANIVIAGFVISGNEPKRVLIRAVGPTLGSTFNFYGAIEDPVLEIHQSVNGQDVTLARNDDWHTEAEVVATPAGGFSLLAGSNDAALVLTLSPGAYTANVRGNSATMTGAALVELYEVQ